MPRRQVPEMISLFREITNNHQVNMTIFDNADNDNLFLIGITNAQDNKKLAQVKATWILTIRSLGNTGADGKSVMCCRKRRFCGDGNHRDHQVQVRSK